MVRIVHYINQFYAGIGGEDKANQPPIVLDKVTGPGLGVQKEAGDRAEVVGMVVCGDGFYGEHTDEARAECLDLIRKLSPNLLIAGPAFNAGRYGFACGDIASVVSDKLGIPTVTGMYPENPGVELYSKKTYIVPCADNARSMGKALKEMTALGLKLVSGVKMGPARVEGYIHRGVRKNFIHEESGGERAVKMLLAKIRGEAFRTEYEMPDFKKIPPAAPVKDLKNATIALVCSGGVVPLGNPDRIRVSSAESYGVYDIAALDDLTPQNYESIHGGYDREWANKDPDVVVPLDVMRELEREGVYGRLHPFLYTTTGTGTAVSFSEKFGREIGEKLKDAGVDAAILTST
jgi:glycine reductase